MRLQPDNCQNEYYGEADGQSPPAGTGACILSAGGALSFSILVAVCIHIQTLARFAGTMQKVI
jgi:hypothetical protein